MRCSPCSVFKFTTEIEWTNIGQAAELLKIDVAFEIGINKIVDTFKSLTYYRDALGLASIFEVTEYRDFRYEASAIERDSA